MINRRLQGGRTFVSFISLICQNALLNPAFHMFRIVRPTLVPCDLYSLPIGGWVLSTDELGVGLFIVPGNADLAGTFDDA
jgi:hypothetical protein